MSQPDPPHANASPSAPVIDRLWCAYCQRTYAPDSDAIRIRRYQAYCQACDSRAPLLRLVEGGAAPSAGNPQLVRPRAPRWLLWRELGLMAAALAGFVWAVALIAQGTASSEVAQQQIWSFERIERALDPTDADPELPGGSMAGRQLWAATSDRRRGSDPIVTAAGELRGHTSELLREHLQLRDELSRSQRRFGILLAVDMLLLLAWRASRLPAALGVARAVATRPSWP